MLRSKIKEMKNDLPIHIALGAIAALSFYPFAFMLISSLKTNEQFYHNFFGLPLPPNFVNYLDAWEGVVLYLLNSFTVTGSSVLGVLAIASISAFVFARFDFPGREFIFYCILSLLMIPSILTLIPSYLVVRDLGLLDTRWALILPYIAGGQVFAIFILRSFFSSIPEELMEAARIDGASEFQAFLRIVIPLSKPILITVAIMDILASWNDYIWPLVTISNGKLWTITLGLVAFRDRYVGWAAWGPLFAGYVIASLPLIILFFFTMKYYIAGLTSGALKM
ncbi:MAG: carbohydrate ABC transporter permease [bacterium]